MNNMKAYTKKFARWVVYAMLALLIISLVAATLSAFSGYEDSLQERAAEKASVLLGQSAMDFDDAMEFMYDEIQYAVDELSKLETEMETFGFLESLSYEDEFEETGMFRYLKQTRAIKDGRIYTSRHQDYISESPEVLANRDVRRTTFCGIVYDSSTNMNLLAFVTPVRGNESVDGIILFYDPTVLSVIEDEGLRTSADTVLACKKGGTIVNFLDGDMVPKTQSELMNFFSSVSVNESSVNEISNLLRQGLEGTVPFALQNIDYILGTTRVGGDKSTLFLVAIFNTQDLYKTEYSFFNTSSGLTILLMVVLLGFFLFVFGKFIYSNYYAKREFLDPVYHCPTRVSFMTRAEEILEQNRKTKFVMIAARIQFFKFISSQAESPITKYIRSLGKLISKLLVSGETYCYDMDGRFFILLHYVDFEEVLEKIKGINKVAGRVKIDADRTLQLSYGIVREEDLSDPSVMKLIDHAMEMLRQAENQIGLLQYVVYDPKKYEECMDKDFIEMNMNRVLAEGNFKVFYQPKYNMVYNRIDGSEALVRWYMPEEKRYYPPATFLPVIENNGFIVKVDHYVFEQVCVYIRDSLNTGRKVYPVSVNVSRMTVEQSDFVDYYVQIKKKYKIRDGLLCIEFTESSNFEDYENMKNSVDALHQAGFLCSIDDFGTGYSSYNCLKSLPMDEIKLDRFFLKVGEASERDADVLKSIIALGKKLGMKVTQEGVSSQEEYNRLKEYGCEIMQGFLYARPMPLEDYISFTTSSTHGGFE